MRSMRSCDFCSRWASQRVGGGGSELKSLGSHIVQHFWNREHPERACQTRREHTPRELPLSVVVGMLWCRALKIYPEGSLHEKKMKCFRECFLRVVALPARVRLSRSEGGVFVSPDLFVFHNQIDFVGTHKFLTSWIVFFLCTRFSIVAVVILAQIFAQN